MSPSEKTCNTFFPAVLHLSFPSDGLQARVDYSVHDGILNRSKSMVHGRMFTLCMLSFAVLCLCILVSLSTLGLAETADIADGKGGFTVLHNIHKQVGACNLLYDVYDPPAHGARLHTSADEEILTLFPSLSKLDLYTEGGLGQDSGRVKGHCGGRRQS